MAPLPNLNDARDLVEKARHDLTAFQEQEHSYILFNLLCTLEHINDWLEKDKQFHHLEPERELIHTSDEANVIRKLCNRVKHFGSKKSDPDVKEKMTYFSDGTSFNDGTGFYEGFYVLDNSKKEVKVIDLCRIVLKKWEALLDDLTPL